MVDVLTRLRSIHELGLIHGDLKQRNILRAAMCCWRTWFCQQEMLCAMDEGKKIQIVLEERPPFFPFDLQAWHRSKSPPADEELQQEADDVEAQIKEQRLLFDAAVAAENQDGEVAAYYKIKALQVRNEQTKSIFGGTGKRMIKGLSGGMVEVPEQICKMIDAHLPDAVTYRRRDFEAASMMRELCRRNWLRLPSPPAVKVAEGA